MFNLEDYSKRVFQLYNGVLNQYLNDIKPRYIHIKKEDVEAEMDFPLLKRLGKKIIHPMHEWYGGKLLKKIFLVRKFGYELSLYKEVKNNGK